MTKTNAVEKWLEKELKRVQQDVKWAWYYGIDSANLEYLKHWLIAKLDDWRKEHEEADNAD